MVTLVMIGVLALIGFLCISEGIASLGLKPTKRRRDQRTPERAGGE